jgi:hypothetical protein
LHFGRRISGQPRANWRVLSLPAAVIHRRILRVRRLVPLPQAWHGPADCLSQPAALMGFAPFAASLRPDQQGVSISLAPLAVSRDSTSIDFRRGIGRVF